MATKNANKANAKKKAAPTAPPELNRDEIVAAACRLINRVGVDSFTMRGLATELQFSPMAAYRHVNNKDELLAMAVDSVLAGVQLPDADQPWTDRFHQLAQAVWTAIEDHRWIPGFIVNRRQPVPSLERILAELRAILVDGGLDPKEAHLAEAMAWTFTSGLLSWAKDPAPYLEFGVDVMLAGLKIRAKQSPR